MSTRLDVEINGSTEDALVELALKNQVDVTEIMRRVMAVYKYLTDELQRPGVSLEIVDRRANTKTVFKLVDK